MQKVRRGKIDPAELFGAAPKAESSGGDLARWLRDNAVAQTAYKPAHHHDDHIRAHCLYVDEPVSRMGMTAWLTAIASLRGVNLLRVKALLNVEGEPVVVHAVQTLIHEPVKLARWPDADRRSRLVFITRDMARAEMEATLDMLKLKPANPARLDPRAYTSFVEAIKKIH